MTQRAANTLSLFLGLVLVALFSFAVNSAFSQDVAQTRGPYMIAAAGDDKNAIWRIDQSTGKVSYCVRNTTSVDPEFIATRPPACSAWSE